MESGECLEEMELGECLEEMELGECLEEMDGNSRWIVCGWGDLFWDQAERRDKKLAETKFGKGQGTG